MIGSAIILAVVVIVSQVLMWGLSKCSRAGRKPRPGRVAARPAGRDMPRNTQDLPSSIRVGGPQLMIDEPRNLAKKRDEEQKRMHGYGGHQAGGVATSDRRSQEAIRDAGCRCVKRGDVAPTLGTGAPSRGEASGGRMMVLGGDSASAPS